LAEKRAALVSSLALGRLARSFERVQSIGRPSSLHNGAVDLQKNENFSNLLKPNSITTKMVSETILYRFTKFISEMASN
jgi:hypothetical protein